MPRSRTAALVLAIALAGCATSPTSRVRTLAARWEAPCPSGTRAREDVTTWTTGGTRTAMLERRCIDAAGEVTGQHLRVRATDDGDWTARLDSQVLRRGVPSGLRIELLRSAERSVVTYAYVFGDLVHGLRVRYGLVDGRWTRWPIEEDEVDEGACVDGQRHGVWRSHDGHWPDLVRTYERGVAHGRFAIAGEVEGEYREGVPAGRWRVTARMRPCLRRRPIEVHGDVLDAKCDRELPPAPLLEALENVFDWDARSREERERFREPIAHCDVRPARPFGRAQGM